MLDRLRLVICTPHGTVFDETVRGARVPSESGQVGLRPREEPFVLIVEPGLVLVRARGRVRFAATAGGLLEGDRTAAVLYTPFAVAGDEEQEVLAALNEALAAPDEEIAARRRLGELERNLVQELRHRTATPPARTPRG